MDIFDFLWDLDIVEKIIVKHQVFPVEVEELFQEGLKVRSRGGAFVGLGRTKAGRYLFLAFRKVDSHTVKIITARDMTIAEKRLFMR